MVPEFIIPELNRVHIAWHNALLKPADRNDLVFSRPANVDSIFEKLEALGKEKIAICVHGGLVSSEPELGQPAFYKNPENKILFDALEGKDVYPIYLVWETGIKESIRSAAKDWGEKIANEIAQDPLGFLKRHMAEAVQTVLFNKVTRYLPKILSRKARPRGLGLGKPPELQDVDIEQNLNDIARYETSRADYDDFDDQDKQEFLETLSSDQEFMEYLKKLGGRGGPGLGPHPDTKILNTFGTGLMQGLRDDLQDLSPGASPQLSLVPRPGAGLSPIKVLANVGETLGRLVLTVGARFVRKEDHGFVATITEEFFRVTKLNVPGILIWTQMKENAREAYIADDDDGVPHAGHYLIAKLADYIAKHPNTQVSLIGHSAGAIHLSYFVEAAHAYFNQSNQEVLKSFQFKNIMFLAPAVNFETFQRVIDHRQRFVRFNIFTMREADEMKDALLAGISKNNSVDKFLTSIYPCSLLYAVSGIAEDPDKGDVPLLGLARHLDQTVYRGAEVLIRNSQAAMAAWPVHINWSYNNTDTVLSDVEIQGLIGRGEFGAALRHGDFDNDQRTALSIAALL